MKIIHIAIANASNMELAQGFVQRVPSVKGRRILIEFVFRLQSAIDPLKQFIVLNNSNQEITILCYGDSNTRGSIPCTNHERYDRNIRWPGRLQQILGEKYHVIEEGLGGRTTSLDDPMEEGRNGKTSLLPCLHTHHPVDLVILMLGTNDLKKCFQLSAEEIARNAGHLVSMVQGSQTGRGSQSPRILLIAPPTLAKLSDFKDEFDGGTEKSYRLGGLYRKEADELGCDFLDAGKFIQSSDKDGIHWEAMGHLKLAEAIAGQILQYGFDSEKG
jgi:lysophospholipase L1-like esterase